MQYGLVKCEKRTIHRNNGVTVIQHVQLWIAVMPGFHHSVDVLPLSFRRSVATVAVAVRTEMLDTSFRIHRDEETRTLIGCPPTAERQKIRFDPIVTERRLRRNDRWQRRNRIFCNYLFYLFQNRRVTWILRDHNHHHHHHHHHQDF